MKLERCTIAISRKCSGHRVFTPPIDDGPSECVRCRRARRTILATLAIMHEQASDASAPPKQD